MSLPGHESPQFTGVVQPGAPSLTRSGDWRREELRIIDHPVGRVAVIGECLATDDELRQAAYHAIERRDPSLVKDMPGSYTSIVADEHGTHFVGDAASQYPLYLRRSGAEVQFSTHTKPFRTGSDAAAPDRLMLAAGVGMPWVYELAAGRTPLEGVDVTRAQEVIHVDHAGAMTTTRHDSIVPDRPLSMDESAAMLREALEVGIERRLALGRMVTADLSGGHDSTTLACIAGAKSDGPLTVVTHHSPDIAATSDDLEHVRRYLALPELAGAFDHHLYEQPAAAAMYSNLDTVAAGDLPGASIRDRGRHDDYYGFLRTLGSELHLIGNGADGLVDMHAQEYLGRFAHLRTLPHFLREVLFVARAEKTSVKEVLAGIKRNETFDPVTRLQTLAHILQTPKTYDGALIATVFGDASAPNWLTPAIRKELAEYAADVADKLVVPGGLDPADYRAYTSLLAMGRSQHEIRQNAARLGMRTSAVYFDNDVLKACFGLPAPERINPRVFKQLMGRALHGLVPGAITSRRTKGDYTRYGFAGLRHSQHTLRRLIDESRLADLGIIDPKKVRQALEEGIAGANMPWATFDSLVAAERWLGELDGESRDRTGYQAPMSPPKPAGKSPVAPMPDDAAAYSMPAGVVAATHPNGAIVLSMPTGKYLRLSLSGLHVLRALREGGSVAAAHVLLQEQYPTVAPDVIRERTAAYISNAEALGLLREGGSAFVLLEDAAADAEDMPVQVVPDSEHTPNVRVRDYAAALGGFAVAEVLDRTLPFEKQMKVMAAMRNTFGARPAAVDEATQLLAALRRVGAWRLRRTACLELSVATVLGLALQGKSADLVLGVRTDPESFHAWPQTQDGRPIRTEADEQITGMRRPLAKL